MIKDKKGQSLVLFIVLLPLLLAFMAFVIDTGIMYNKKIVVKSLIKNETIIEEIKEKFNLNKVSYKKVYMKDECIIVETSAKAVFGKIINKNEYEIIVKKCE